MMSEKSVKELIRSCDFKRDELPRTILSLTPRGRDTHGYGELVDTILSHLSYLPIDRLRIHEEVIGPARRYLARKIEREMRFTWPLLVSLPMKEEIEEGLSEGRFNKDDFDDSIIDPSCLDTDDGHSRVVLDGTHRTESLRYLAGEHGIRKAPVLEFNYRDDPVEDSIDDSVGLCPWCRSTPVASLRAPRMTMEELVDEGILIEIGTASPGFVRENNFVPLVAYGGRCFTFGEFLHEQLPGEDSRSTQTGGSHPAAPSIPLSPKSVVSLPVKRDYELSKEYLEVDSDDGIEGTTYFGFDHALSELSDERNVVVFPRNVSKLDVMEIAWAREVFPRKTTRHVFSFRVFDIPISLSMLREEEGSLGEDLERMVGEKGNTLHLEYLGKDVHIMEGKNRRYYPDHMFRFVWEE